MLRVSVNGGDPVPADSVVLYDDETPIALGMRQSGAIIFCDALRDKQEFIGGIATLGLPTDHLPEDGGTL